MALGISIVIHTIRADGKLDYRGTDLGYVKIHYRSDDYWVIRAEAKRFKNRWGSDLGRNEPVTYYLCKTTPASAGQLNVEFIKEVAPGSHWHIETAKLRNEASWLATKARRAAR